LDVAVLTPGAAGLKWALPRLERQQNNWLALVFQPFHCRVLALNSRQVLRVGKVDYWGAQFSLVQPRLRWHLPLNVFWQTQIYGGSWDGSANSAWEHRGVAIGSHS
jgi:hypothetical protein